MSFNNSNKENENSQPQSLTPVHVEIEVSPRTSRKEFNNIEKQVKQYLERFMYKFENGMIGLNKTFSDLKIASINISIGGGESSVSSKNAHTIFYIFKLRDEGKFEEVQDSEDSNEEITSATYWNLPAKDFGTLWDSLIFEDNVKDRLLNYVETAMKFGDRKVNPDLITWNRVVLLHGPPGTGKTSLCKALAQKLAIRMSKRYDEGVLFEINAHSLFSKWFSESGKLVMRIFENIRDLLQNKATFLCILIDEVESLAAARAGSLAGTEPSDSIRVVNALLTQLDTLKSEDNVLIMTTSNITQAIDLAFVDRADIKQYIGNPGEKARYQILLSCIKELERCRIIDATQNKANSSNKNNNKNNNSSSSHNGENGQDFKFSFGDPSKNGVVKRKAEIPNYDELQSNSVLLPAFGKDSYGMQLKDVSKALEGFSGRYLRKLPFVAYANYVHGSGCSLDRFLNALMKTIENEKDQKEKFKRKHV